MVDESNLETTLRWAVEGRHSGVFELRGPDGEESRLTLQDGEIFLGPEHPETERIRRAMKNPATEMEGALAHLGAVLATCRLDTFGFRSRPDLEQCCGPLPWSLLEAEIHNVRDLPAETPISEEAASEESEEALKAAEPETEESSAEPSTQTGDAESSDPEKTEAASSEPDRAGTKTDAAANGEPATPKERDLFAEGPEKPANGSGEGPGSDDTLRSPAPHPAAVAIWQDQFHLTADPFALTPDPAFLYLSDCHAEALAGLKLGLWERRGLLVMTGEVGTGKTTLLYSLLSQLEGDVETAYLSNTLLSFEEILHSALTDFGIFCESRERLDLIEALNGFLKTCANAGKTVALVIDEAQNLSDEAFEGLRLLLNFETYHSKLLQIVLVGQPELSDRLAGPGLRQVRDRIAVRCHLRPLSRREARGYIEHRLETVGGSADLFTTPALGLVIRKSQGIPRRINIYCHNAMLFAFGKNLPNIRRGLVAQAIRDMDGSRPRHE